MDATNLSQATRQFADARRTLVNAIVDACRNHGDEIQFPDDPRYRFLFNNGKGRCMAKPKRLYKCGDEILLNVEFFNSSVSTDVGWHMPVVNLTNDELYDLGINTTNLLIEEQNASTTN